jgi:hypothetical protein
MCDFNKLIKNVDATAGNMPRENPPLSWNEEQRKQWLKTKQELIERDLDNEITKKTIGTTTENLIAFNQAISAFTKYAEAASKRWAGEDVNCSDKLLKEPDIKDATVLPPNMPPPEDIPPSFPPINPPPANPPPAPQYDMAPTPPPSLPPTSTAADPLSTTTTTTPNSLNQPPSPPPVFVTVNVPDHPPQIPGPTAVDIGREVGEQIKPALIELKTALVQGLQQIRDQPERDTKISEFQNMTGQLIQNFQLLATNIQESIKQYSQKLDANTTQILVSQLTQQEISKRSLDHYVQQEALLGQILESNRELKSELPGLKTNTTNLEKKIEKVGEDITTQMESMSENQQSSAKGTNTAIHGVIKELTTMKNEMEKDKLKPIIDAIKDGNSKSMVEGLKMEISKQAATLATLNSNTNDTRKILDKTQTILEQQKNNFEMYTKENDKAFKNLYSLIENLDAGGADTTLIKKIGENFQLIHSGLKTLQTNISGQSEKLTKLGAHSSSEARDKTIGIINAIRKNILNAHTIMDNNLSDSAIEAYWSSTFSELVNTTVRTNGDLAATKASLEKIQSIEKMVQRALKAEAIPTHLANLAEKIDEGNEKTKKFIKNNIKKVVQNMEASSTLSLPTTELASAQAISESTDPILLSSYDAQPQPNTSGSELMIVEDLQSSLSYQSKNPKRQKRTHSAISKDDEGLANFQPPLSTTPQQQPQPSSEPPLQQDDFLKKFNDEQLRRANRERVPISTNVPDLTNQQYTASSSSSSATFENEPTTPSSPVQKQDNNNDVLWLLNQIRTTSQNNPNYNVHDELAAIYDGKTTESMKAIDQEIARQRGEKWTKLSSEQRKKQITSIYKKAIKKYNIEVEDAYENTKEDIEDEQVNISEAQISNQNLNEGLYQTFAQKMQMTVFDILTNELADQNDNESQKRLAVVAKARRHLDAKFRNFTPVPMQTRTMNVATQEEGKEGVTTKALLRIIFNSAINRWTQKGKHDSSIDHLRYASQELLQYFSDSTLYS